MILDNHLVKYGEVLNDQSELTSESMRVLSAQNWVGFIKRAHDDLIPKIVKFCQHREDVMKITLPENIKDFEKWNFSPERETEELKNFNFTPESIVRSPSERSLLE